VPTPPGDTAPPTWTLDYPSLTTLIFDLDGVIWRGQSPIPGAAEAVERLRAAGVRPMFATNNSSRPPAHFAERLGKMGISARDADVVTSSSALRLYLEGEVKAGHLHGRFTVFVVGEHGIAEAVTGAGGAVVEGDAPSADLVVAGIDRGFNYARLASAQRLILGGARFLATNRDATFPVEGGVVPGAGSIVSAVETASGVVPLSMGKPEPLMVQLVLKEYGLEPRQAAMIGDRLDTDVACGHRAGIASLLVTTGVTSAVEAEKAAGEERPDAVFGTLAELTDKVLSGRAK